MSQGDTKAAREAAHGALQGVVVALCSQRVEARHGLPYPVPEDSATDRVDCAIPAVDVDRGAGIWNVLHWAPEYLRHRAHMRRQQRVQVEPRRDPGQALPGPSPTQGHRGPLGRHCTYPGSHWHTPRVTTGFTAPPPVAFAVVLGAAQTVPCELQAARQLVLQLMLESGGRGRGGSGGLFREGKVGLRSGTRGSGTHAR